MTKEQVEEKVINIIVNDLLDDKEKKKNIDRNSKFFEDIEIDSVVIVNLVILIEEKFNISINDITEFVDCLKQVSNLVDFIYQKIV